MRREWSSRWSRYRSILAVVVCLAFSRITLADAQVRLRNDLTPGALAVYDVLIRGERTTPELRYAEQVVFEQRGTLTLLVLDDLERHRARRAWMMTVDEPRVITQTRDGEPMAELSHPKSLGLPPAASQLRTAIIDASDADASPVGGSRVQQAGLLLALDFAHWPDDLLAAGGAWETPSERDELKGVWTHAYEEMQGRGSKRLAIGTFTFTGELAGALTKAATIEEASGEWRWRVAKRGLESSQSRVRLEYGPEGGRRTLQLDVTLTIRERTHLKRKALDSTRDELSNLSELAGAARASESGREALAKFIEANPKSLWRPVARDLLERVTLNAENLQSLSGESLDERLLALVLRWQQEALSGSIEALEPIRATFRELANANRSELQTRVRDTEPNTRAMAVFCIAFGSDSSDLAVVTGACRDTEPRVRMWAAYGLAERRDPKTDPEVLLKLLQDDEEKVRRRACMAVTTCIGKTSPKRERFMDRLLKIIEDDPVDEVHPYAAQAITTLAIKNDLPKLIAAEEKEDVPHSRWQLEQLIERLGGSVE